MIDEITYIVGELVSGIDNSIFGTINNDTMQLEVCDTKWLRKGKTFVDAASLPYKVIGIEYNENVSSLPVGHIDIFSGLGFIQAPFYLNGTKLATNEEWTKASKDTTRKTPLIWLLDVIRERKYGRGDSRDFAADLRIFFLDETNIKDYYSADHRKEVVYPMKRLAEAFLEVIKKDRRFETIEDVEFISFNRFGVERENGMFQNILDANLSGVEMRITLTKRKENCKC